MKWIKLILCSLFLGISSAFAQTTRCDLNVKRATLEQFVRQLEEASGYSVIYGEEVRLKNPISVEAKEEPIRDILFQAFQKEAIGFKIEGGHILLYERPLPTGRKFTICGYVTDSASCESLIGANVYEVVSYSGTFTNPFGFYSLTLPEGETQLSFSYLGYDSEHSRFMLDKDTVINISLVSNNRLSEVVVLSDRKEVGIRSNRMSAQEIPMTQIRNTPALLGEADLLKTIQLMPGVQTATEGFSGLYVRGGGPDQNLILLDGIPIYNADHLLGAFSIFTPEAIKKVTLFKGSFPARFGGRLSSIVDIRTNDGDMNHFHGTVSAGLLTNKLHLEGPIWKNRTSFCLTARRTYLDWLARPFMDDDKKYRYYFYDVNAKVNHRFSDRSRLFLSFYKGKDHCDYKRGVNYQYEYVGYFYNDRLNLNWGNTVAALRWNYLFSNKLFNNTTVSYNHYKMLMSTGYRDYTERSKTNDLFLYGSDYHSGIHDYSVQSDFDYTPRPEHHVKFGGAYTYHRFSPEVMTSRVQEAEDNVAVRDTLYNTISGGKMNGHELSIYAEDDMTFGRLGLNAGVHLSLFSAGGKRYFSAQPRASLRYRITDDWSAKASFTQMAQYVHLLSSSTIALPTDLWVPVTKNIRPMIANQYAIGAYYTGLKGYEFSVEGYYKQMRNVLEYQDGASFFASSSSWEEKVEMGEGRSMGIEFLAQKNTGKTTGWIAYTLAKSDRQFENGKINNGKRFPYKYDKRHNLNICVNHKFSDRFDIGATWVFSTGGTVTVAEQRMNVIYPVGNDYLSEHFLEQNYIPKRNNFRLPCTHRLNLGVNFHKRVKRGEHTWNVSVFNAYNAMNPQLVFMEQEVTGHEVIRPDGSFGYKEEVKNHLKKLTLLPCLPSFTYTFKF